MNKSISTIVVQLIVFATLGCKSNPTTPQIPAAKKPPVISSFSISPSEINKGESASLSWEVSNATSISIDQGVGVVSATGSKTVTPSQDTTYTLTASNDDGTATKSCAITVIADNKPPVINSFSISPSAVNYGESASLSWDVSSATSISIDQGVGVVSAIGSKTVTPSRDTTYTLTASNDDGTVNGSCGITVSQRESTLTVRTPAEGVTWTRGTTYTIFWTKVGPQDANVRIQLLRYGVLVREISAATRNDGAFIWLIPASLPKGGGYKVRVKTLDNLVSDDSALFSLN